MDQKKIQLMKPNVGEAEIALVREVIESGYLVEGPMVKEFENIVANYMGVKHAISCTSWTTGAELVFRAIDLGKGDEVICPDFTHPATALAVITAGGTPVFVDVDKETFEQCFFLATAKHNGTAFKRWLNKQGPDDFDYNSIDFPHCQQSWKLYSIVKKYLPKMYKLNYQQFVVEQDHNTVKQFINRTLKVKDPTESQIKHIRDELKIYNDRNNELVENNDYERWKKEYQLYE